MFASRIKLKTLSLLCRSLGTMLDSGVSILKALHILAKKTGDQQCRRILSEVAVSVEQGNDLSVACHEHDPYFPELFCDLVAVSEQSGSMPEVLVRLADHYETLLRLKRSFISAIAWPVIQVVAAIFLVAFVIYIIGAIGQASAVPNGKPADTLGLGLVGASGAITWLTICFGTIGALWAAYYIVYKGFQQQRLLDVLLLSIPVVGNCMRSFAIARFAWAFYITQNAGMNIVPSLAASLKATGNGAFAGMTGRATNLVKEGEELSVALEATGLFPEEFLQIVQIAETSGTVPEALHRLSPQFEDQARRSLNMLVVVCSWLIWGVMAAFIVFIIFSFFLQYVRLLNSLMP